MQESTIVSFLKSLGCFDASRAGEWVTCKCPLAPWTHKSGKDSTPSFAVNIESGYFNCFACHKGTLSTLLGIITMHAQKPGVPEYLVKRFNFELAESILNDAAGEIEVLPDYEAALDKKVRPFEAWPQWWLNSYPAAMHNPDAAKYLAKRGMDMLEAQREDLRYDAKYGQVLFPFRNAFGALAGARGRAIDPNNPRQHHDYQWGSGKNTALTFLGEHTLPDAVDHHAPVMLTEGQFDRVALLRGYPYVLANLTAKPTWEKLKLLNSCPDGVILALDNDKPGADALAVWKEFLKVPVWEFKYPIEYKDPDAVPRNFLLELQTEFLAKTMG